MGTRADTVRTEEPRRERRPSAALVVGFLALLVGMIGTARAGTPDSVISTDIVDGAVKSADVADDTTADAPTGLDVANGTLTSADVAPESIGAIDVASSTLTGSHFAANSLGSAKIESLSGGDILESSLFGVPFATDTGLVDGFDSSVLVEARGDSADTGQCSGSLTTSFETCADSSVVFPRSSVALVTASGTWHAIPNSFNDEPAETECDITSPFGELSRVLIDSEGLAYVESYELPFTLQAVSPVFPSGTETFYLKCHVTETGQVSAVDVDSAYISVVVVGSG